MKYLYNNSNFTNNKHCKYIENYEFGIQSNHLHMCAIAWTQHTERAWEPISKSLEFQNYQQTNWQIKKKEMLYKKDKTKNHDSIEIIGTFCELYHKQNK